MNRTNALCLLMGLLSGLALLSGCGATRTQSADRTLRTSFAGPTLVELTRNDVESCDFATLYFDYNSDTLTDGARSELERVARCLGAGESMPLHLSGAADPRGTEEYNLALGDRRARSVRGYLLRLGVDPELVTFGSVGEELAIGSNEATWALDRHVAGEPREMADHLSRPTASLR
jgi:peptidoglycan-associated lipoprotein